MEFDRRYLESGLSAGLAGALRARVDSAERERAHNSGGERAAEQWRLPKVF